MRWSQATTDKGSAGKLAVVGCLIMFTALASPTQASEVTPLHEIKQEVLKANVQASPVTVDSLVASSPVDFRDFEGKELEIIGLRTINGEDPIDIFEVNLPSLIRLVQNRNLDIAITQTQIMQAKGYFNEALSGLFPSVRALGTFERLEGGEVFFISQPIPLNRRTYQPRLALDYQVPLGGRVVYAILTTKNQIKRAEESKKETVQEALLGTFTQYFKLLRDSAKVQVVQQALREADAQVAYSESRFNAGFATQLDVMQSKTLQAQRKSEVLEAENQREISAITLATMLDLPLTMRLEPQEEEILPITFLDEDLTLEHLYKVAIENRPDVKQLSYMIEEAKNRYGMSRSDLFPTVAISGFYRGIGPSLDSLQRTNQYFASINWDILRNMGWGTLGDMQVQKARIQEAILNREKQLNAIQNTVAEAYQNSKLYRAKMKVALQRIASADEAYRIAVARLKFGTGINLEVVQAQKDLTDARLEYQNATMEYNVSQLKLLFETGQMTPFNLEMAIKHSLGFSGS